jgi:hypothetical protein
MQDVATADELFKRALAVDCMDSNVSGSYVEFFQKHLEADYRCASHPLLSRFFVCIQTLFQQNWRHVQKSR